MLEYAICWYDYDGHREYRGRFASVASAAHTAGDETLKYGADMAFDVVEFVSHRVVENWRQQVPNLETF